MKLLPLPGYARAEAIRYAGSVGVTSTTSGTPQLAAVSADGQSFFGLFFDVTTPVSVVLSLHADFAGHGGVDFNLLNSTAGTATFSERAFGEENGTGGIARQDVLLTLTPGSYDMTMRMGAHFQHADGSVNAGASAAAEFSLVATAIPEAQTWLILVTGLPLVGALGRRHWKGSFSSFARH